MKKTTCSYPRVHLDTADVSAVAGAGGALLVRTAVVSGFTTGLSAGLARWRRPTARHDPAKVLTDLAVAVALGGDCLADVALLRAEPGLYGPVGSDATISRTVATLAADADRSLRVLAAARKNARARVWAAAGDAAPNAGISAEEPLIIDLDATLLTAHSEKENAAKTWKKGFGFHPLLAFVDHGPDGTGELLAIRLRPGNAGSNTVTDHIAVTSEALSALPGITPSRPGRRVLVRTDGAGGTKTYLKWLHRRGVAYSVGFTLPARMPELYRRLPARVWSPALDADGEVRDGAHVADLTGLLDLSGWPPGMRVIVRRERPHPGAQLRFDDVDGYRLTAFATNTTHGQLQVLEMRHRRRARCEDRIRIAKDTGLRNLPLHGFDQNRIWCAIVMTATDLTAWTQLLAFADTPARRWEPKRLRLRIFTIPATLARHARQLVLHIKTSAPWADLTIRGWNRLAALAEPG